MDNSRLAPIVDALGQLVTAQVVPALTFLLLLLFPIVPAWDLMRCFSCVLVFTLLVSCGLNVHATLMLFPLRNRTPGPSFHLFRLCTLVGFTAYACLQVSLLLAFTKMVGMAALGIPIFGGGALLAWGSYHFFLGARLATICRWSTIPRVGSILHWTYAVPALGMGLSGGQFLALGRREM